MKKILSALALVLSACSSQPTQTPQQAAVTAYLKRTLDDPASYQPVSWGKAGKLTRADNANIDRRLARVIYSLDSIKVTRDSSFYASDLNTPARYHMPAYIVEKSRAKYKHSSATRDSMRAELRSISNLADTSRYGTLLTHVYRAKNKAGGLVLDSAEFLVDTHGKVVVWDSFKKN